jgi:hypothetical protein
LKVSAMPPMHCLLHAEGINLIMATSGQHIMLSYALLSACMLACRSVAAESHMDPFMLSQFENNWERSSASTPLVGSGQVYVALCTTDDKYQPWHQQPEFCRSIKPNSFPDVKELGKGKGFYEIKSGWSEFTII